MTWHTADGSVHVEVVTLTGTSPSAATFQCPAPTHDGEWFAVTCRPSGVLIGYYDNVPALRRAVPGTLVPDVKEGSS